MPFWQLQSLTQADLGGQSPAQSHRMGASVTGRSWQKQQGSCWGGRSSCASPYCAVTLSPAPMPHGATTHHKAFWGRVEGRRRGDLPPLAPGKREELLLCVECAPTFIPVPNWGKVVWSAGPAGCVASLLPPARWVSSSPSLGGTGDQAEKGYPCQPPRDLLSHNPAPLEDKKQDWAGQQVA